MKPLIHSSIALKGHWVIDVIHHDGTHDRYNVDNRIVNMGLDIIGAGAGGNIINGVAVGTGNAAVTASDTSLVNGIAATTATPTITVTVVSATAPYIIQTNYEFTFPLGAVVGNIAEIAAIPYGSSATGNILSRALIEVAGSPGTIALIETDQLIATWQLQSIMAADIAGAMNVITDGVTTTRNYTIKPIGFSSGSSIFNNRRAGAVGVGSGTGGYPGISASASLLAVTADTTSAKNWDRSPAGAVVSAYVAGSYAKTITYKWATNKGTTFQWACWDTNWFAFQLLLDAPITITNDQSFEWPITVSWADASGA